MTDCNFCGIQTKNDTKFCSHSCSTKYNHKYIYAETKKGCCKICSIPIKNIRVYCDDCWASKLKNKNGKTKYLTKNSKCQDCGQEKTTDNTYNNDSGYWAKRCRVCDKTYKASRVKNLKDSCIEYKGGKCKICGYNRCRASLEFHHLDPSQKDFSIAEKKCNTFGDKIKKELDKCELLCANCHAEEHILLKEDKSLFTQNTEQDWFSELAGHTG